MRFNALTRMHVVKKEDKELKLKDFIQKDILARRAEGTVSGEACYRLVALSAESPVAKALASLAPEAANLGIEVQAVFVSVDRLAPVPDGAASLAMAAASCRLATDPRLRDAHEQLVLNDKTAWIGDCMRRDPAQRDAYECYSEDCAATADWAARSFDRIWAAAEPVKFDGTANSTSHSADSEPADPPLAPATETSPVTAATRH
jgi:hypothetical protein